MCNAYYASLGLFGNDFQKKYAANHTMKYVLTFNISLTTIRFR